MALPPTIPTSFVPHPTQAAARKRISFDFAGAYSFLCYMVFLAIGGLAVGVYIYSRMLHTTQEQKSAQLVAAQEEIDTAVAQDLVRLHDRIRSAQTLLDNHVAFSRFLRALEGLLPQAVRFTSLNVTFSDKDIAAVTGSGTAKSFNALAAASASLSTDGRIRDAIFSRLTVNKDNSVSFSLSATLNPKLIAFTAPTLAPQQSAATSTLEAATTTVSTTTRTL